MISYLPSSPSPGGNSSEDFLRYNDGAIFCFILCNQKKKGKVCCVLRKGGLAVALNFFVFSDARVMLIILRRALFIECELGFSCTCVCVCVCDGLG